MTQPRAQQAPLAAVALDEAALAKLRELDPDGRHGVVERVLNAFEASLRRMLAQLSAESARGGAADSALVANLAHTLKSSAASVGALELSRTCGEVERRLRSGEAGSLDDDIARLQRAAESALATVEAMLRL